MINTRATSPSVAGHRGPEPRKQCGVHVWKWWAAVALSRALGARRSALAVFGVGRLRGHRTVALLAFEFLQGHRAAHGFAGAGAVAGVVIGAGQSEGDAPVVRVGFPFLLDLVEQRVGGL